MKTFLSSILLVTSVSANAGVDVSEVTIAQVPEPDMVALFGLGLVGVGLARLRKNAS